MKISAQILITLLLATIGSNARADILFLDFNNSPKEVEAARTAAKKTNQEFVVFPDVTQAQRKKAERLKALTYKTREDKDRECTKDLSSPACKEASNKFYETYDQAEEAERLVRINFPKIDQTLADREKAGKVFSTVVVSGHDGTGKFSGVNGTIDDRLLAQILGKNPNIASSIRSLHLWGCYTTSPGSLMLNWKKRFPNTALISGYEDRAPLNDKPAGWHYLQGVIEQEPELLAVTDSKKLQEMLRKIPGAIDVSAAVNVCENYASTKQNFDFKDLPALCEEWKKQLLTEGEEYECFYKGQETRCENPPANVESGPLRAFYGLLQRSSACQAISHDKIFSQYSRDDVIRLIFSQEMQNNLAAVYNTQLHETDAILKSLGAPDDLRFAGLNKLTRRELLHRIDGLLKFVDSFNPSGLTGHPKDVLYGEKEAKLDLLRSFQLSLSNVVMKLNGCVPFEWTEPGQTADSSCLAKNEMGFEALTDALKSKKSRLYSMSARYIRMDNEILDKLKTDESVKGSNVIAEAKARLYGNLLGRIKVYRYNEDDEEKKATADLKVAWAEKVLAAAEAGSKNPVIDPIAVKAAMPLLQANVENANFALLYNDQELDELKKEESKTKDNGPHPMLSAAIARKSLDQEVIRKKIEALSLIQGTSLAGEEKTISPENLKRLNKLELEIGLAAAQRYIRYQQSNLDTTDHSLAYMKANAWDYDLLEIQDAEAKRNAILSKLKPFEGDYTDLAREIGADMVRRPDFDGSPFDITI